MTIKINIVNKRPTVEGTPIIVCGNSDYSIEFNFDDEWSEAAEKIARFVYVSAGTVWSREVPFTGNTVAVPVLSNIREVSVGVYAGDLQTTAPARIPCERSILCGDTVEGVEPEAKETAMKQMEDAKNAHLADIAAAGSAQVAAVAAEGQTQVTAVKSEGQTQVAAVDAAGAAQVDAIAAEGQTQVTAVKSEGEAKLDAIAAEGQTQVAAVKSEGQTQVAAVDAAGAAQVDAIAAEGQTQVTAVKSEGEAKLDAIAAEGQTQVAAVKSEGQLTIEAVQAAGSEQLAAVEAEGEAKLDAIAAEGQTQVTAVKSEGQTQVTAVQAAGAALQNTMGTSNAGAIVCNVTGETLAVQDASDKYLAGLTLYGKTTQNGTPTPDAPVELESVGDDGSVAVTVCGKNLLNANGFELNTNKSLDVSEDGYTITTVGGNRAYAYSMLNFPIELVRGKTIFVSFDSFTQTVNSAGSRVQIICKSSSEGTIYKPIWDGEYSVDYFVPIDCEKFTIGIYTNNSNTVLSQDNTVVVKGLRLALEQSAVWEVYKEPQTLIIQPSNGLSGIPVTSGGNYTDENGQQWVCDEIDFARGKYVQRVGKINVYEASVMDWGAGGNGHDFYIRGEKYDSDPYFVRSIPSLCSSFANGTGSANGIFRISTTGNSGWGGYARITFRVPSDVNTVALFKEYVGENCTVLYQLKDAIETDLTAEEIAQYSTLHTNKPNTTAFNDSGAHMAVDYVADTKLYIDQKIAAISAAVLNV